MNAQQIDAVRTYGAVGRYNVLAMDVIMNLQYIVDASVDPALKDEFLRNLLARVEKTQNEIHQYRDAPLEAGY
jgi:hypothetical protein